jgi:hypothetical protein
MYWFESDVRAHTLELRQDAELMPDHVRESPGAESAAVAAAFL